MKGQDLKRRINGAKETVKITGAMRLIASSRMSKAEKNFRQAVYLFQKMSNVVSKLGTIQSKYFEDSEGENTAYVVVAGDKGLCGDYNHKILDFADNAINKEGKNIIFPIGQFAKEFFSKQNAKLDERFFGFMQSALSEEILEMTRELAKEFCEGKYKEIYIIFTDIKNNSVAKQRPTKVRLFPLNEEIKIDSNIDSIDDEVVENSYLENENDINGVLLLYIAAYINYALYSSEYAFYYQSLGAMTGATKNGEELVDVLTTKYNRLRQEKITNELADAAANTNNAQY